MTKSQLLRRNKVGRRHCRTLLSGKRSLLHTGLDPTLQSYCVTEHAA
jgi:hypothetical protein